MLFTGHIERGHGRATELGFPTINIPLTDTTLSGVYVGRTTLHGKTYFSAVFADQWRHILESHVLDFDGDVDGEVNVEVIEKIRDTQKFSDDHELHEAIARDIARVRQYAIECADGTV